MGEIERLSGKATREALAGDRDVVRLRDERGQVVQLGANKDGEARRTFRLVAYTGAQVERWYGPFTIDLSGIEGDDKLAILYEHNDREPVGVATKRTLGPEGLVLEGHMLGNELAREIAANADDGLPYKCSVGIRTLRREEVEAGAKAQVNGRTVIGPHTIARQSRLFETSFITCDPADPSTTAEVMHREDSMADLETATKSTEILRAEAAKLEREATKARAEEFRKAFPDREAFAQACALDGLTLVEAKARLADVVVKENEELKAAKAAPAKPETSELDRLKAKAKTSGAGHVSKPADPNAAEVLDNYSATERAKAEWHGSPDIRKAFPDTLTAKGVDAYAAYLHLEERAKAAAAGGFGGKEKFESMVKLIAQSLRDAGGPIAERLAEQAEKLSSWGKAGPDYAEMTVRGFLGFLYRPLENALGGSWGPRLGVMVQSTQETETYRFFGQVPQFREWLGNRSATPLAKYSFTATNKTYEITMVIAIVDWLFEKAGQLQMRLGETGRRAGGHWEKLISSLITTNGNGYDGVAFFATSHTLGGDSGTMKNRLTSSEVPALDVATAAAPTPTEMANAILGVICYFFTYLDDRGEPINGDAKKFVIMVPVNLWASAMAAVRNGRLAGSAGADNPLSVQDFEVDVQVNPRLTTTTKFYAFREDSSFKPFVLQEATGIEVEFQGPGSDQAFKTDSYALGLKTRRTAQYGEWAHAIEATLS